MKNVPVSLVILGFVGLILPALSAQNSFNSSALPTSQPMSSRLYQNPAANLPPLPQAQGAAPLTPNGANYGAPGAYPIPSSEPVDPNHKLGRGDRLSFRVVEDRDDKVWPLFVTDSGEVDVPLIGPVHAAGKSTTELQADIKSQLEREYYYHATVIMGLDSVAPKASRGRVYVTGAVRQEGAVELPTDEPMTVSKAVARSGGFKDFGDQSHVRVERKGGPPKGIVCDVKAVHKGEIDKDVVLQPEDIVVVPEKWINF